MILYINNILLRARIHLTGRVPKQKGGGVIYFNPKFRVNLLLSRLFLLLEYGPGQLEYESKKNIDVKRYTLS